MLHHLLDKTNQQFDAIVFIDDTKKNINNVAKAFKETKGVDTYVFHYTKVEEDRIAKNGVVLTQKQANKMANDWSSINKILNSIFPGRKNGGECLGK